MPGKARVHELAKELGLESKNVLSWLKDNGEFVKSASSTIRVRLVRDELDDDLQLVQGEREVSCAERRDAAVQVDLRGRLGVVGAGGASHEEDRDDRGDPRLHPVAQ